MQEPYQVYRDKIDDCIIKVDKVTAAEQAHVVNEYYQPAAIAERLHQWRERFNKG